MVVHVINTSTSLEFDDSKGMQSVILRSLQTATLRITVPYILKCGQLITLRGV